MSAAAVPYLVALVIVIALSAAWQLVRHPMERRFAIRDAVRRPRETVLVIAGSLLGTALIAGSFIVGDTLDASIKQRAWTQLGPVDEVITVPDARRAGDVARLVAEVDDPSIEDVMPVTTAAASISSDASGEPLVEPSAQIIELDFDRAQGFGGDPSITGVSGPTPALGEVVVTRDLAEVMAVEPGDDVTVHIYGARLDLRLDRVVPQQGLTGFWMGRESSSPNAFVRPGTIAAATAREMPPGAVPPAGRVLVSNRGGVEEGAEESDRVVAAIDNALAGTSLRVDPVKKNLLNEAEAAGENLGSAFLTFGMFAVIAGVLLLVNIFVMLAEERKSQLGMMRAVGTRRSNLVRIFFIEGVLYSFAASAIGTVAGLGVGWAIVRLATPIFSSLGDAALDLRFNAEMSSIVGGFSIGLLISVVTIALTSLRLSRINIIRAIRDLPEPNGREPRLRAVVGGSLLAVAAAAWFASSLGDATAWAPALLGLPVTAFALVPLGSRLIGRRRAIVVAASVGLGWGVFGNGLLDNQITESGDLTAFVFQGVLLVFSAVVLLTQVQENLARVIRRLAARRLSLRLGLAYPLARRFRTGLTLGMYSLVIFTLVLVGVLSNTFGEQVQDTTRAEAGGFDILITAGESNPPDRSALEAVAGVERVVSAGHGVPLFQVEGETEEMPWPATGITAEFVETGAPELSEVAPRFDGEDDAWQEMLTNRAVTIVSPEFLQPGGPPQDVVGVGDRLTVVDPVTGAATGREVIGLLESDEARSGAYMSFESLDDALGGRAIPSRLYAVTSEDDAHDVVAARIQGRFVAAGVEARSFSAIVEDGLTTTLQFIRLVQIYLGLGLIVGIAGLGVVMVRAVRDRRRHIGVLRALGFTPSNVGRAFVLESAFVAIEGIVIGSALGLVTASQLIAQGNFGDGVAFVVPWTQIAVVCTIALAASLAATAAPARRASSIPPAVALRTAD